MINIDFFFVYYSYGEKISNKIQIELQKIMDNLPNESIGCSSLTEQYVLFMYSLIFKVQTHLYISNNINLYFCGKLVRFSAVSFFYSLDQHQYRQTVYSARHQQNVSNDWQMSSDSKCSICFESYVLTIIRSMGAYVWLTPTHLCPLIL